MATFRRGSFAGLLLILLLAALRCSCASGAWLARHHHHSHISAGSAGSESALCLVNPNPVYPYAMLDDLSDERVPKNYRAIYLENQYLKVTILPELGGHVYSIYDKLNRREMLYRNRVIKYGLVGPRGAWIAGGMEFSFPFAHTTQTVSTVESDLHQNADGSATAVVGAIDWVSQMYWQIAITLRPDTARLEEGVTLFNATPLNHLYLFWTNTAVPATDDLQYIYPMRETISDDPFAIVQSWPVWEGVDQSWYKNDPSAMAIFARDVHRDFFGVYYHQSNYGVVHVSDFRQNPGKKLWSWGTARSGRIWDTILSDDDGPYNEIQSGRFATQGYREFMEPHRVEQWTEYWYPVSGLDGGFVEATANWPSMSASPQTRPVTSGEVKLSLSPVATDSQRHRDSEPWTRSAAHHTQSPVIADASGGIHNPCAQIWTEPAKSCTSRFSLPMATCSSIGRPQTPVDGNPDFDSFGRKAGCRRPSPSAPKLPSNSSISRAYFSRRRGDIEGARKIYRQVLQRDPGYVPALLQEAFYFYSAADYAASERLIHLAQQRENENPVVAYAAGLIYRAEGRLSLATDAFWNAIHYGPASAPGLSLSAAYVELGEIAIRQGEYAKAVDLLSKRSTATPRMQWRWPTWPWPSGCNGDAQAAAILLRQGQVNRCLCCPMRWRKTGWIQQRQSLRPITHGHTPSAPIRKTISPSQPGITTSARGSRPMRCCTLPSPTCPRSHSRRWSITISLPTAGSKAIRNKQRSSPPRQRRCQSRRSSPTASRMRPF